MVIGASAGGIPPIERVLSALPRQFSAAVFVTIHTAAEGPRLLSDVLSRLSSLPVSYAADGDAIRKSRVYVAPPDRHMLLDEGVVRVTAGPRENRHRPAIDPLFRSAARAYGPRVVAVLFSGLLDDGTAGLKAVGGRGGISIVQDPEEARFASMPLNAVENDSPQYVLPVQQIGPTLVRLAGNGNGGPHGEAEAKSALHNEVKIAEIDMSAIEHAKPGPPSPYVCPECNGTLFEMREGKMLRFRCRVGHAYGTESLLVAKNEELEGALWTALRTLEEKAALHRRLAEKAASGQNLRAAKSFRESAEDMQRQGHTIRKLLLEREQPPLTGTED